MVPWVLILLIAALIIAGVAIAFAYKTKGKKHEPDYYTFFVMGITWIPLGIVLDMPVFFIMGLVFMAVGIKNKDKWKKNHKAFAELYPKQKEIVIALTILGVVLLILAVLYTFLSRRGII